MEVFRWQFGSVPCVVRLRKVGVGLRNAQNAGHLRGSLEKKNSFVVGDTRERVRQISLVFVFGCSPDDPSTSWGK